MAGLKLPRLEGSHEPVHLVRRRGDTGRFTTVVA
jgi:hypothetical protein